MQHSSTLGMSLWAESVHAALGQTSGSSASGQSSRASDNDESVDFNPFLPSTRTIGAIEDPDLQAILFPAPFGQAIGERFDDLACVPKGLHILRIKSITLHHGAWVDSIETTYLLSDGSDLVCSNGPKGAKSSTYTLHGNEIIVGLGGLLGFIKTTELLHDGLMFDYIQFHIQDTETGDVRIEPEEPNSYGSSQGADFFVQGPILAFSGRMAGYLTQIQPYLAKEKDVEFGLPAPGLAFDDYKECEKDPIKRISRMTIRHGSWIDGLEVEYELKSGRKWTGTHGGSGGVATVVELGENEIIESIGICNSGPFPFCDAVRFYLASYDTSGELLSRRTVPDKSLPAFGYEYEYGQNIWIRAGKNGRPFAFAGKSGSYLEEVAFWVVDEKTGEERLVKPAQVESAAASRRVSGIIDSQNGEMASAPALLQAKLEEHRRSFSSGDALQISNSLDFVQGLFAPPVPSRRPSISGSPEIVLPSSLPASPSLPVSLGRLSISSSNGSPLGGGDLPLPSASPGAENPKQKKRLSGHLAALQRGSDLQREAERLRQAETAASEHLLPGEAS